MKNESNVITLTKEAEMQVMCAECNEPIPPSGLNISNSIAKCTNCGSIYSISESEFEKRRSGHPIFLVPDGTEVLRLITSLEITTSWLRASKRDKINFDFIFAAIFGIFSTLGLGVGIFTASLIISLIALVFVVASSVLLYVFIANFVNKTHINISEKFLKISHKPLRFISWKEHNIPLDSIEQLYVKEYQTNRTVNNVPLKAFGLFLKKKGGEELKIMEDMNKETSLYIEQEIEEFLDISNKKMIGEIDKQLK